MTEAKQFQTLRLAKYDARHEEEVSLRNFVGIRDDPRWGPVVYEPSFAALRHSLVRTMMWEIDGPLPPEADRTPGRAEVSRVLRAHGVSGQSVAQLRTLSRDMRRDSRRRGREFAAMVDADSGTRVGTVLSGAEGDVDIRPHLRLLRPNRQYVQFHTHPGSSSFSDADAAILVAWAPIRAIVVLGVNGAWYVLSRAVAEVATSEDVVGAYWRERNVIDAELAGSTLPERSHAVWARIADQLGLRYDRVQREGT